jgi:hypothetical protein
MAEELRAISIASSKMRDMVAVRDEAGEEAGCFCSF